MRIRTIVAGSAALALLAGCSGSGGTTGTPTNATQPTSTSGGAPKVQNPLDVKAFEADPCSTVTPAQVQAFGVSGVTGKVNPNAVGKACVWLGATTSARMSPGIAILPDGTNLTTIHAKKDTDFEVFEPLPDLQGYPAFLTLINDGRASGSCEIVVGVSDEKVLAFTFQSSTGSPKYADPCGGVTEFANFAITTIKAGAK